MKKITLKDLPDIIPIFPLSGGVLMPCGRLPLNIFEPRYLDMVRYTLKHNTLIGMIQPKDGNHGNTCPDLYPCGCAGRVTSFSETEDERMLITLTGVCRFEYKEDATLEEDQEFRQARVNWAPFANDLEICRDYIKDRDSLLKTLRSYLNVCEMFPDWDMICYAPDLDLINSLAMVCPFDNAEKQALLEAKDLSQRAEILNALMAMSLAEYGAEEKEKH